MDFYLDSVLDAFSKMDARLIGDLLDPQYKYTYEEVSLETLKNRLAIIFKEFQEDGDTDLEVLRGTCSSLTCRSDLIRTAYRFVGNNTRNYLDLRFILEPTEDLQDQVIKGIFHCNYVKCIERKDCFGYPKQMEFSYDDQPESQKSQDTIHRKIAKDAYQELFDKPKSITRDEAEAWIKNCQPIVDYFDEKTDFLVFESLDWDQFIDVFYFLQNSIGLIDKIDQVEELSLSQIHLDLSEKVKMEKVRLFERILVNAEFEYLIDLLKPENDYRMIYQTLELVEAPFEDFSRFLAWFKPLQLSLVKKYYSLTEVETEQFLETYEYIDPKFSLTQLGFHMEIRERARKRGEYIPLK